MDKVRTVGQRKEREQSEIMRRLFPVLDSEKNEKFTKIAEGFGYTTEIIFTVFTALILIEIFVREPKILMGLHSLRATFLFLVAGMTLFSISKGHSIPEVSIYFYFGELLLVLGIIISSLVISSVRLDERRRQKIKTTIGDVTSILILVLFTLFNGYILGKEIYRYYLGKRHTPVNTIFTLIMALFSAVMSIKAIIFNRKLLQK
jgi:hypothetical protein